MNKIIFFFCGVFASLFLSETVLAQTIKDFKFGLITVHPFAQDQLEVGGILAGNVVPATSASGPHIRNGVRIDIDKKFRVGAIWDFGPAPGGPMRLFEGAVSYTGTRHFQLTAGVFNPSFGLSSMQPRGDSIFPERASISTITRNIAAGAGREAIQGLLYGDQYHFAVSGTAGTAGPGNDGSQRAVVFRAVVLPFRNKNFLLHLGLSGEYIFRPATKGRLGTGLSFSDRPENGSGIISKFLNAGFVASDSASVLGGETAISWKKLLITAEGYNIHIGDKNFNGWYGTFAYTVLGLPRQWRERSASFSSPKCAQRQRFFCSGGGAVELAVRYSRVSLNSDGFIGGRQDTSSIGVNWYPSDVVRVSLEYSHMSYADKSVSGCVDSILSLFQIAF